MNRISRIVGAAAVGLLALGPSSTAFGTTAPGNGGDGCNDAIAPISKVGTTISAKFTVTCGTAQYRIHVQGIIYQEQSGKRVEPAGTLCASPTLGPNKIKTCSTIVKFTNDPSGLQTYDFVFEGEGGGTYVLPKPGTSDGAYTCAAMGCGFATQIKKF